MSGGTATSNSDFALVSGTLTFAEGETIKTFTIPIWNDGLGEGDETLNLILNNPTGGATLGARSSTVLNIRDNDFISSDSLIIGAEVTVAAGIAQAATNPGRSAIGFDGTNSVVMSCRQIGTPQGLFGVILSSRGVALKNFHIPQAPCPNSAAVGFDGSNYLVVFQQDGQIFGTRVSPSGDVLEGPGGFAISTGIPFSITNFDPAVAFDGINYLVVWTKFDPAFSCSGGICTYNLHEIFGARVTPQGQVLDEFPIFRAPGGQVFPSVAFDGVNYLVVWSDTRSGSPIGPEADIFGARVTPGGIVLDPEGIQISTAPGSQGPPHVIFDGTNYFVVWRDGGGGILGRRIRLDGTLLDGPADSGGIAINTDSASKGDPRASFDGRNYFVVWHVNEFGPPAGIYVARVSTSGDVVDREALLISEARCYGCRLVFPHILANGDTSLVTWVNNAVVSGTTKDIAGVLICGFTSADPNSACFTMPTSAFFPLAPGTTWTYRKNGALSSTTEVLNKTVSVEGVAAVVLQEDDGSQNFFTSDSNGVQLHRLFIPKVFIEGLGNVNLTLTSVPPIQMAEGVFAEIGQTVISRGTMVTNRLPRVGAQELPYIARFTVRPGGNITVPAGDFDVVGLQGTIEISGQPPALFTFDLAKGIGIIRSTTSLLGITETAELIFTNAGVHDLAVTKITAPKSVILNQTKRVKVEIQNRGPHTETIQDVAMLGNLVSLRVTFDCVNDPAKGPGHQDFSYIATVNHAALDGNADTHPEDDVLGAATPTDVVMK